jgi:hypothetical protein
VIDVEDDEKKRKPMAARSGMWEHFTKIFDDKGQLVKGKCKYCSALIGAHPVWNGTSGMHRHFSTCKRNPYRAHDDAKQCVLSVTEGQGQGTSVGTWKFDQDLIRAHDDAKQCILSVTEGQGQGTSVGTWKFDQDLIRSAFTEMII